MALKEEKEFAISGKQKDSVREETDAVSGMRVTIVHKNQNTLPPSRNHYQRLRHSMTPGDTGSVPVHIGTETLVARDEDRITGK